MRIPKYGKKADVYMDWDAAKNCLTNDDIQSQVWSVLKEMNCTLLSSFALNLKLL